MIYTCTMNTAIDLYVELDALKKDIVNRTHDEDYQPNGKGVNVSTMLHKLGIDNIALGFVGGFSGKYIEDALQEMTIQTDFIEVDGITRINVFVNADEEYKIVNQGPTISSEKQNELINQIKAIPANSTLVVSGSLPKGVSEQIIVDIAKICHTNKVKLVLDTSVRSVKDTLVYEPYLLKPNEEEVAHLFGKQDPLTEDELITCGKALLRQGAKQVIISRGADGAIYFSDDKIVKSSSPKGKVVNTACSGDSLLATFLGKIKQGKTVEDALAFATATGASTAFTKGLSDLLDVPALQKQIKITTLEE